MKLNSSIAKTYLFSNKKLTAVAVMGVVLGMSIYIFMNCLMVGFDKSSNNSIFKSTAHIRIYRDNITSKPLLNTQDKTSLLVNPSVVPENNLIINPNGVIQTIQSLPDVTYVAPQVLASVYLAIGKTAIPISAIGIVPAQSDSMFKISSTLLVGSLSALVNDPNSAIIGIGIAEKANLFVGKHITITSAKNISKTLKIVGIFKSNNSKVDKSTIYTNIRTSQNLLGGSNSYITDINVNIKNPEKAKEVAKLLQAITGYTAEGWKEANETLMAANKMRKIVITFVSLTILLVAGFGIYNILNMTVTQKINDIAILKAMGFKGKDVISIFVTQALSIGIMGVIGGVFVATLLITLLKKVYVGGDIGYFPIDYEPIRYLLGIIIGMCITFFAGYLPARKAAQIDPVGIFRK